MTATVFQRVFVPAIFKESLIETIREINPSKSADG